MNTNKIRIELTYLEVLKLVKALSAAREILADDCEILSQIKVRAQIEMALATEHPASANLHNIIDAATSRGFNAGYDANEALKKQARNAA